MQVQGCQEDKHSDACCLFSNYREEELSHEERVTLADKIDGKNISLSDSVCVKRESESEVVSLFEGLLTSPNGHLTIKVILDGLMDRLQTNKIKIKLRSGALFRVEKEYPETRVLEALLKVRRETQGKGSRAEDAVSEVFTHPVIEAFIRQKWHAARFLFFGHIRVWFLFTISFSCYLRVEINTQLIRNEFMDKHLQWNTSLPNVSEFEVLLREEAVPPCLAIQNTSERQGNTTTLNREQVGQYLKEASVKICHPQNDAWWPHDSSRILYLFMLLLSAIAFLLFLFRTCRDQLPDLHQIKGTTTPRLQVLLDKNTNKNRFQNLTNLFTAATIFVVMLICFHSDGQNLKLHPARPLLDYDDGFRFIEIVLLFLAFYFIVDAINEMVTKKKKWSSWLQLFDPSVAFQLVSSFSAFIAVIRKCFLTTGNNSGAGPATAAGAIGITFAYLCLILKHGRYSSTAIGNFSTMFHIILKKLRSYLVVAFVLLFGFSFGFWVVKQHENKEDDARFKGFLTSIKACFVMFFGGFDEYDDVLSFDDEIKKDHHLTLAAFYVLYLMMIIVTSLGMLNILLAAIITDYHKNMKEVHLQNLLFMAQYSVVLEQGLGREIKDFLVNKLNIQSLKNWTRLEEGNDTYTYCTLDLCYAEEHKITHIHPEDEFSNIIAEQSRTDFP